MPTIRADIEHLLRRTGFVAHEDVADALVSLDWDDAVDAVLDVDDAPDPHSGVPSVVRPPAALDDWGTDYVAMVHHWLDRSATSPTPIIEKMVLFWHGHLTSAAGVVRLGAMLDQHVLFRQSALGRFDELVTAAAVGPAMLQYLDGRSSHRWSPNENFPRELLELFCLGVGNYTEEDVRAAARAFTGYRLTDTDEQFYFDPSWHDDDDKTFMGVTRNWDGPQIIDHVLNGPTRLVAARHVARRLWEFFAYPDPADDIVEALATAFSAADLQIAPLVRAILLRPEFRSDHCRRSRLRSPIELAVSTLARLGLTCADVRPDWYLPEMGQRPFVPPNVDGWPQNEGWVSTSTYWGKHRFADYLGHIAASAGLLDGSEGRSVADAAGAALELFGVTQASPATRQALETFVADTRLAQPWLERRGLVTMTCLSPEFALA